MDEQLRDTLKSNAEIVVSKIGKLAEFDFGYDAKSVTWVDGFIERQRPWLGNDIPQVDGLINMIGSYLGEAIIHCYGGEWHQEIGKGICIRFPDNCHAYPFTKVRKQFENGPEDSIASFFTLIPVVFKFEPRSGS